jgi:ABC-type branched-subunit amino acid transport system substrate-binding protein
MGDELMIRARRVLAGLACLGLLVAACGDDDDGDTTATTAAPDDDATTTTGGDAVEEPTGDPIVVGGVAQLQFYEGVDIGAEARFERANREGGVNGRPIEFLGVQDDGADAQRNTTLVRSLVQQEDVFAVVPITSDTFPAASSDFLAENHVPYVGWGVNPGFCGGAPYGFAFSGCLLNPDVVNSSLVDPVLEASGIDMSDIKVAIQAGDNPQGHGGNDLYEAIIEDRGAQVVYKQADLPPVDAPTSYAPWVQAIMDSDPNIVYLSTNFPNEVGLAGALRAAGYEGLTVGFTTYAPGLLQDQPNVASAIEGHLINVQLPPQESDSPAIEQLQEDLDAIGADTAATFGVSQGYWQADLFIQMLEAAPDAASGEELVDTLNEGFEYRSELEGGSGDLSFPDNHDISAPCAALVRVEGGEYVVDQPYTCYENLRLGG